MELTRLFTPADLIVGFAPPDKWEAIRQLVRHLVDTGRLPEERYASVLEQVLARERSMSTGMERGIAIPHSAVDEVKGVCAALGIVTRPGGLAFESIDGQPARLIALLVIPRSQKLLHIRTLADVARVLGVQAVREALVAAQTREEAWAALTAGDAGALR
jgi:mannitol/fructose-specific phosphotransferase system IIA component (Ntr-type)